MRAQVTGGPPVDGARDEAGHVHAVDKADEDIPGQ